MKNISSKTLQIINLSLIQYDDADTIQRNLQRQRTLEEIPDTLLLLEHPLVITMGKRGTPHDILATSTVLQQHKVQIASTDRGGQNTIHGPGQLVGYIIVHLYNQHRALHAFINTLEQSLIDTMQAFGIDAFRHDEHVGVWTDKGKIASIGISVNKRVTRHGFALNVNPNMDMFNWIIPCGITNAKVTSMHTLLSSPPTLAEVSTQFSQIFAKNFSCNNIEYPKYMV